MSILKGTWKPVLARRCWSASIPVGMCSIQCKADSATASFSIMTTLIPTGTLAGLRLRHVCAQVVRHVGSHIEFAVTMASLHRYYVKIDDDVIYIADGAIAAMLDAKLRQKWLFVSANTVNHGHLGWASLFIRLAASNLECLELSLLIACCTDAAMVCNLHALDQRSLKLKLLLLGNHQQVHAHMGAVLPFVIEHMNGSDTLRMLNTGSSLDGSAAAGIQYDLLSNCWRSGKPKELACIYVSSMPPIFDCR